MSSLFFNIVKKYYTLIIFTIFFSVNIPILDNIPFGDDYHHIFHHSFIKDAPHPFVYLNPWSIYFKSWGFTYSILWILYRTFGEQFVFYRAVNLLIHFINFLLFRNLADKYLVKNKKSHNHLIGLMFLFNPLSILTTTWIFQIKTTLSLFFILVFTKILLTKDPQKNIKSYLYLISSFLLSLISKVCGILLPFYALLIFSKKISFKRSFLLVIPLFLLSGIYGLLNIKGVTYLVKEVRNIEKPVPEMQIDHVLKTSDYRDYEKDYNIKEPITNTNIDILNEVSQGITKYIIPIFNVDNLFDKHIISLQNLSRLILSTVGFNNFYPFYENNLLSSSNPTLIIHVLFALLFLLLVFKTKDHFLILSIILFLPVSGYFYVPYMKFSFTSDHWFYPAFFPLLIFIGSFFNKKSICILMSITFLSFIFTNFKYHNFQQTLKYNYAHNQNKFILEHIPFSTSSESSIKNSIQIYHKLLSQEDFRNIDYYNNLFDASTVIGNYAFLKQHSTRFAADLIRSNNIQSLGYFIQMHGHIYNNKQLVLLSSLPTVYSHHITNSKYKLVVEIFEN